MKHVSCVGIFYAHQCSQFGCESAVDRGLLLLLLLLLLRSQAYSVLDLLSGLTTSPFPF